MQAVTQSGSLTARASLVVVVIPTLVLSLRAGFFWFFGFLFAVAEIVAELAVCEHLMSRCLFADAVC
jgi:hypothetical protein